MSDKLTAQDLVDNETRDGLNAMATNLGIEAPEAFGTDLGLAEAIIEAETQHDLTTSAGAQDDASVSQDILPTGDVLPVTTNETPAETPAPTDAPAEASNPGPTTVESPVPAENTDLFESLYGHLEGDDLEAAKKVFATQLEQWVKANATQVRGYLGD